MGIKYLLDTNTISEPVCANPNPNVLSKLQEFRGMIAIASVVWHEILYGVERLPHCARRKKIEYYLENTVSKMSILPYDAVASRWHAIQRAKLEKKGMVPPVADGQIAAIAKCNELTLITRNTKDFKYFEGLRVQNWLQ